MVGAQSYAVAQHQVPAWRICPARYTDGALMRAGGAPMYVDGAPMYADGAL